MEPVIFNVVEYFFTLSQAEFMSNVVRVQDVLNLRNLVGPCYYFEGFDRMGAVVGLLFRPIRAS